MKPSAHIVAADIGNTSATIAEMRGLDVLAEFDVSSHAPADDLAAVLRQKLPGSSLLPLVIASVNPRGTEALEAAWRSLGGNRVLQLGRDIKVPIENATSQPERVGQDRLVNALAARARRGPEVLVVDFGTAITFDVVKQGSYRGGVITPGIGLAMEALHQKTALLPLVRPQGRPPVIGTDTVSAINSGVFYGYIGLISNILRELLATYETRPPVLATGGYGAHIAPEIAAIDEVLPHLTHEGIALSAAAVLQGAQPGVNLLKTPNNNRG
ncbi:MAG: type III pantothenate kinase [Planctomycetes bacterium]|nr:type III pantothenate kinase [Planctomycetota bacterium]